LLEQRVRVMSGRRRAQLEDLDGLQIPAAEPAPLWTICLEQVEAPAPLVRMRARHTGMGTCRDWPGVGRAMQVAT
jgi:hypothetical protein